MSKNPVYKWSKHEKRGVVGIYRSDGRVRYYRCSSASLRRFERAIVMAGLFGRRTQFYPNEHFLSYGAGRNCPR
jgi:hypothetical protein